MPNLKIFYVLIAMVASIAAIGVFWNKGNNVKKKITFSLIDKPYSTDPMEFDAVVHHISFGSVLSPLISNHKLGEYVGIIAESWSADTEQKKWIFKIRENIKFSNGELITPEIVRKSLTRIAFLLHQKKSESGLFEDALGINKIKHANDKIQGIRIENNELILEFSKSKKTFLDAISFGLYSIAHPADYDEKTGLWKNPKKVISSGPYEIIKWDEKEISLKLRDNFLKFLWNEKAPKNILLKSNHDISSDIATAFDYTEMYKETHHFVASGLTTVFYIQFTNANSKKSPFHNKENREFFRNSFYNSFADSGIKPYFTIFPLELKHIKNERPISTGRSINIQKQHISHYNIPATNKTNTALANSIKKAILEMNGTETTEEYSIQKSMADKHTVELKVMGSFFRIDSLDETLKFMFLSKEGIKLPDETGEIKKLLKENNFDYNKIEELISKQCLFFPYVHAKMGFWVSKQKNIDFSQTNLLVPPIEFQWLGVND